jgi:hypothetical protein
MTQNGLKNEGKIPIASADIIRYFPTFKPIKGKIASNAIDVHLRNFQGSFQLKGNAVIITNTGEAYSATIIGFHFLSFSSEGLKSGQWQHGDRLVTITGVPPEKISEGSRILQYIEHES